MCYDNWIMRLILLSIFLLSGCVSANVTASTGKDHTLRVGTSGAMSSPAIVENAIHEKAADLCPAGWEKLGERVIPRQPQSPMLSPTIAVEWQIRCF